MTDRTRLEEKTHLWHWGPLFSGKKAFKARYGTSKNDASNSRNDHLRVNVPLVILGGTSNELVSGSRLIPVEAEPLTEPAVGAGSVVFLPKLFWVRMDARMGSAPGDLTRDEAPPPRRWAMTFNL